MNREYRGAYYHPFFQHSHLWGRRFLTREEKKELQARYKEKRLKRLEHYKESLEKELLGVNERLEELKKETE